MRLQAFHTSAPAIPELGEKHTNLRMRRTLPATFFENLGASLGHCACGKKSNRGREVGAEPQAGAELRVRKDPADRKPGVRGRGRAGGGGGAFPGRCRRALCRRRAPARQRPGRARLLGMVSKALLRLVSAVNRKTMKLLLGIALLAYVACEYSARWARKRHSFPSALAGSRVLRARRRVVCGPGGGWCAAPGWPCSQCPSLPRELLLPPFSALSSKAPGQFELRLLDA